MEVGKVWIYLLTTFFGLFIIFTIIWNPILEGFVRPALENVVTSSPVPIPAEDQTTILSAYSHYFTVGKLIFYVLLFSVIVYAIVFSLRREPEERFV